MNENGTADYFESLLDPYLSVLESNDIKFSTAPSDSNKTGAWLTDIHKLAQANESGIFLNFRGAVQR